MKKKIDYDEQELELDKNTAIFVVYSNGDHERLEIDADTDRDLRAKVDDGSWSGVIYCERMDAYINLNTIRKITWV